MERIISKGDDFVVDTLFYFKPVQRFEYRGDMFSFGGSSYCALVSLKITMFLNLLVWVKIIVICH